MESRGLKIIIVEDDAVIAQLIESDLQIAGHQVLDVIHKPEKALDAIYNHRPDLIILDIHLGGSMDGIDIGKIINEKYNIPFIYLTAFSDVNTLNRAKTTQPCAYVVKPYKPQDLESAITIGLFNFESRTRELTPEYVNSIANEELTPREFEIVCDMAEGLTNSQISEKQFVSLNTIKWHLQKVYAKFEVNTRTALVRKVLTA